MVFRILRAILKRNKKAPVRGRSIITYAVLTMVVLLVVNKLPSSLTKSNPILAGILILVVFVGLIWLGNKLDEQLKQLPFYSIFERWEIHCTTFPRSNEATWNPYLGILIYSPLLIIPFILGHYGRELMIPFACIMYAVVGYCLEAFFKWLWIRQKRL